MSRIIVVTGTDTGVGKTIATAALAARALGVGSVTVVKPTQTGVGPATPEEVADVDVVAALTGCATREHVRLAEPLAPDTAARRAGVPIPAVAEHVHRIRSLDADTVIVEGAGGLLVRLDTDGGTLLDLAAELGAEVYVVTRPGLGTLNHTELTVAALRARSVEPAGLIIGAWPEVPGRAETSNRADLPRVTGAPLLAVLPENAGRLPREQFAEQAPRWFSDQAATSASASL